MISDWSRDGRPTRNLPDHLTPSCLDIEIFIPMGDIGGQGWGRKGTGWRGLTQESARERLREEKISGGVPRIEGGRQESVINR